MEDCLFYRDARLVSLNEVGGEPERFGVSAAEFHQRAAARARLWPPAMVALTTHDTKRGEDVRARIGVLSQVPSLWAELRRHGCWRPAARCRDRTVPVAEHLRRVARRRRRSRDELRDRLHAYAEKAIREAAAAHLMERPGRPSSRRRCTRWLDAVIDGPVGAELTALVARLDPHARSDSLGQKLLALTAPGVPDVYQGTELWEDSLVDPDNRRPVDYAARATALDGVEPSQDPGGDAPRCGCAASARRRFSTAATRRCSPTARPPSTWWPSCAATTCWWR